MNFPWFFRSLPTLCLLLFPLLLRAQLYCPTNINFESGNLSNWKFYTAANNGSSGLSTFTQTTPLTNRHVLTNGSASDFYGGFPIVDPFGGSYSLRIGNDGIGAQVDQARYVFTVPSTVNNYSLVYRYAVVFEDPLHQSYDQPFFRVRVYDSATGAIVNCASFTYVSQNSLPGFLTSPYIGQHARGAVVYYRPWATASLNLTGQAGKTLVVEFTSADCAQTGHFGYGYVDLNCGLFSISSSSCNPTTSLSAPAGFKTYTWYNSNYTTKIDTGQNITVATPVTLTTYRLVLTPYPGYGCPDTLFTQVIGSSLAVSAGPDTMLCNDSVIKLQPVITGNGAPYNYSWSPNTGLSCTACLAPMASPKQNSSYVLSVTDSFGCTRKDTVSVRAQVALNVSTQPSPCFATAGGTASALASQGTPPYVYSWNTSPSTSAPNVTQLLPGNYTVTATDARGCNATSTAMVSSPPQLNAAIASTDSVHCAGGSNGKATAMATGGVLPYSYSWNSTPAQLSATATGLIAGTYILTVTDSNGCIDTVQAVVSQPPVLMLNPGRTNPKCFADSNGALSVLAFGGNGGYQYALNAGAFGSIPAFTKLTSGSYILHIRDSKGCTLDSPVTLISPSRLQASINIKEPSCYGDSTGLLTISATGGIAPYQYAKGTLVFGSNPLFAGLTSGSPMIHVRDSQLCILDTMIVIGQPQKLRSAIILTPILCNGDSIGSISMNAIGGKSPYTFAIGTAAFSGTSSFTQLKKGVYALHLQDSAGCHFDTSISLAEPAPLKIQPTIAAPACAGSSTGSITMNGVGGTAPYRYALNTSSFGSSNQFTGLAAGTYALHIRDTNNCVFDTSISITQPAGLILSGTTTRVYCNGGSNGSAQVTASGGTGAYSYSWSGLSQTGASVTGLAAGSYSVTVADSKGCNGTLSLIVTQPAALAGTVSVVGPVCFNTATGTATVAVSGGNPPYTYSWNTLPAQIAATATGLSSGSYNVVIVDSMGCRDTFAASVPQTPAVSINLSATPPSCFGFKDGSAAASASGSAAPFTYSWNTSPVQQTAQVTGLSAGVYTVLATSAVGCTATSTITITQPAKLVLSVADSGTCIGTKNGVLLSSVSGGTLPYSYTWGTSPLQIGSAASGLGPGQYQLLVTDAKGCKDSSRGQIVDYALPTVDAGPAQEICLGQAVQFTAQGAAAYTWTPATGLSCASCNSPSASPIINTVYTVSGVDEHGCIADDTVSVLVVQHVEVGVEPVQKICEGDTVVLRAWGGIAWQWLPASGMQSHNGALATVRPDITRSYQVVITENRCFTDTIEQWVNVVPLPDVNLGPDLEAPMGSTLQLHADLKNAVSFEWMGPDGLSCRDCADPVLKVPGKVQFVVLARNELGCVATDTVQITDICDEGYFHFPNVFTPNGDGQNDRFYPQGVASTLVGRFMIYDRWGEIVFSATNIYVNDEAAGWDGTFKGQALKPDVYVYVMDAVCAGGKKVILRGDVSLIR